MFEIPREPLWKIFTPEILVNLQRAASTDRLAFRLDALGSGGLNPSCRNKRLRAVKSAWEAYLSAAFACGLFEGPHGIDLRNRLTGIDDANFRSAMSECFAVWYFAGHMELEVEPRPKGRKRNQLEFSLKQADGDIKVEVKAPHRAVTKSFWWGDDSDLLESALQAANKQFSESDRNLLVIVPDLRISVFQVRTQIERAFIGEEVILVPIDLTTGDPAGPDRLAFKENGRLVKRWAAENGKTSHARFTRVAAILCLEERKHETEIRPSALIVHNPNARRPLPKSIWPEIPEFFFRRRERLGVV